MESLQSNVVDDLVSSIVQIFNADGFSVGSGFLFHEDGLILTASHVVSSIDDQRAGVAPPEEVVIEFMGHLGLVKERVSFIANVNLDYWVPFLDGDICVLKLLGPIPSGARVLPIGSLEQVNHQQNIVRYYGFPDRLTGSHGEGKVMGKVLDESLKFDVLQIDSRQIAEGYSGSPVLDINSGQVIGLLSFMKDKDRAYLIPSSEIKKTIPSLVFKRAFEPQQHIRSKVLNLEVAPSAHAAPQIRSPLPKREALAIQQLIRSTAKLLSRGTAINTPEDLDYFLLDNNLDYVVNQIDTSRALPVVWEQVIDILKYNKTRLIVDLIEQLFSRDKNISHYDHDVAPILDRWKKISKNPNRYIFEKYLSDIVSNNKYIELDKIYVELVGERDISQDSTAENGEDLILDPIAVEQKQLMSPEDFWKRFDRPTTDDNQEQKESPNSGSPKIDSILNIAKTEERFALIGAPGSGKTFTLQKILFRNAKSILQSPVSGQFKLPILIISNRYNDVSSFEDLILKAFPEWGNPELERSNFLILLDGLNEINPAHQQQARQELNQLLHKYPDTSFILSSRKYGFSNHYNLTVFELKDLNPNQVKKYISSYYPSETERIWEAIHDKKNSKNLSLAYNPLTLFMIIFTYDPKKDTVLPLSRGSLYRDFLHYLLNRDTISVATETTEELLSELAFEMRIKDFNPSILSVTQQLKTKLNNDYDAANQLLDQLCDTYILRITQYQKKQAQENEPISIDKNDEQLTPSQQLTSDTSTTPVLTVAEAKEEETVSFMHESYLEFFCSLELKRTFLAHGKLPINFAATEWFETLLMASDLFTTASNLQRFISYVYTGGQGRKVPFKVNIGKHKRRIRQRKYALRIDLDKLNEGYWFERLDIACKLAYNIKDKFPDIYRHFEQILLDDLLLWRQTFLHHIRFSTPKNEQIPDLSILFKAAGGLSSKKIFQTIFEDPIWQMIWLIWVDDKTLRTHFDGKNQIRPDYFPDDEVIEVKDQRWINRINDWSKLNLRKRFTQLIDNLSDFELFYDYLIGEQEDKKLNIPFANHQLDTLRTALYSNMPLKLQKKLYERTQKLSLLERIGRQDLEYYIEKFNRKKHDTHKFVQYLFSFTYNPKVQQKLLELLSAEEVALTTQAEIFRTLLEKFYCVRQVLVYLEKNIDKVLDNKLISNLKVSNYLSLIPSELIPSLLKDRYFSPQNHLPVVAYCEKLNNKLEREQYHLITNGEGELLAGKIKSTVAVSTTDTCSILKITLKDQHEAASFMVSLPQHGSLYIEDVGAVDYVGISFSGGKLITYLWVPLTESVDSFKAKGALKGKSVLINETYVTQIKNSKVTGAGKINHGSEQMLCLSIDTISSSLETEQLFLPEIAQQLAITKCSLIYNTLTVNLATPLAETTKNQIAELNFIEVQQDDNTYKFKVANWSFAGKITTTEESYFYQLEDAISSEELKIEDWSIVFPRRIHPDDLSVNTRLREQLASSELITLPVVKLIKKHGVSYLFHHLFPNETTYGIVLRIIADHNSVLYYSNEDEKINKIYLEKKHLRSLNENDIVVVEDKRALYPIDNYERTADYGFITGFVNGVQFADDQNRYFFILNERSKDFFTHSSRIDFYPELYDVISFFPCKNTSAVYTDFPLARKLKRLNHGNQEEYIKAENNIDWILKYHNSLELEPHNMSIRQELVELHLNKGNYEQALTIINGYPEERRPLSFILQKGNTFLGLNKYLRAMREYQLVFHLPFATKRSIEYNTFNLSPSLNLQYIERITLCLNELGDLSEGVKYLEEYFRNHDYSADNIHLVNQQIAMQVKLRKNTKAQALINRIPEEFYPQIGQSFFLVAKTYAKRSKNAEQAIILFEQALTYMPTAKTFVRYALFTYQIGDFVRANSLLKQALEKTTDKVRLLAYYHSKLARIEKVILLESISIHEKFKAKIKYIEQLANQGHSLSATKVARALHSLYRQKKIDINPLSGLRRFPYLRSGKDLWSSLVYEPLVSKAFRPKKTKAFSFIILEYAYTLLYEKNTEAAHALIKNAFNYLETGATDESDRQALHCELYALSGKVTKAEAFRLLEVAPEKYHQKLEEAYALFMLAQEHTISNQQSLDQYINALTVALTIAEYTKDLNPFNNLYKKAKTQFPSSNRLIKIKHYSFKLEEKLKKPKKNR